MFYLILSIMISSVKGIFSYNSLFTEFKWISWTFGTFKINKYTNIYIHCFSDATAIFGLLLFSYLPKNQILYKITFFHISDGDNMYGRFHKFIFIYFCFYLMIILMQYRQKYVDFVVQ